MIYCTSRVYSPNQFDVHQDLQIWNELVSKMERINDSIWKIWTIADVFRTSSTVAAQASVAYQSAYPFEDWAPVEKISQIAASYLRIEQNPGQCSFTLASTSQAALQNLQALIANLYEPVTLAGLDDFLQQLLENPVQFVELFDRETGIKVRNSFTSRVNLRSIFSEYPPARWDLLNLSVNPYINDPLPVVRLQIKVEAKQAWFLLAEKEQFLSRPEYIQAYNLFTLTDMAFGSLSMPVPA